MSELFIFEQTINVENSISFCANYDKNCLIVAKSEFENQAFDGKFILEVLEIVDKQRPLLLPFNNKYATINIKFKAKCLKLRRGDILVGVKITAIESSGGYFGIYKDLVEFAVYIDGVKGAKFEVGDVVITKVIDSAFNYKNDAIYVNSSLVYYSVDDLYYTIIDAESVADSTDARKILAETEGKYENIKQYFTLKYDGKYITDEYSKVKSLKDLTLTPISVFDIKPAVGDIYMKCIINKATPIIFKATEHDINKLNTKKFKQIMISSKDLTSRLYDDIVEYNKMIIKCDEIKIDNPLYWSYLKMMTENLFVLEAKKLTQYGGLGTSS